MRNRIALSLFTFCLMSSTSLMAEDLAPLPGTSLEEKSGEIGQAVHTLGNTAKSAVDDSLPSLDSLPKIGEAKELTPEEIEASKSNSAAPPVQLDAAPPAAAPAPVAATPAPEAPLAPAPPVAAEAPATEAPVAIAPLPVNDALSLPGSEATAPLPVPGMQAESVTPPPAAPVVATPPAPVETKPVAKVSYKKKAKGKTKVRYKNVLMPETIYMKKYDRRNPHLPMAFYEQDYDALLFVAIRQDNINGIRSMLDFSKRSINKPNRSGDTPLIAAVKSRSVNAVHILLGRNADTSARDANGLTAEEVANQKGYTQLAGIIAMRSGGSREMASNAPIVLKAPSSTSPLELTK